MQRWPRGGGEGGKGRDPLDSESDRDHREEGRGEERAIGEEKQVKKGQVRTKFYQRRHEIGEVGRVRRREGGWQYLQ